MVMPVTQTAIQCAESYAILLYDTIRYDTRCHINVRSKANMSQLNLPHGQMMNVFNKL